MLVNTRTAIFQWPFRRTGNPMRLYNILYHNKQIEIYYNKIRVTDNLPEERLTK